MAAISRHPVPSVWVAPGGGLSLENPAGGVMTFLIMAARSGGAVTALETTAAVGEGPPLHVHRREDELIYVLEGRFRVKLDDELFDAPAGAFVFVSRGTAHTWQATADPTSRMFAAVLPAATGFEQMFARYAELAPADRGPAAFHRLGRETGALEVVGPPLAVSDPEPTSPDGDR